MRNYCPAQETLLSALPHLMGKKSTNGETCKHIADWFPLLYSRTNNTVEQLSSNRKTKSLQQWCNLINTSFTCFLGNEGRVATEKMGWQVGVSCNVQDRRQWWQWEGSGRGWIWDTFWRQKTPPLRNGLRERGNGGTERTPGFLSWVPDQYLIIN